MNPGDKINFILSAFVGALIFVLGIGLLGTDVLIDRIPKPNRTYLGIVFIIYAIYRGFRAKQQYEKMKRESE